MMFNSRSRHPDNDKKSIGELQLLGKPFAINLPTELAEHNLRHCLFIATALYALSDDVIQTILEQPDQVFIKKKSALTPTTF
jgi:hypothetical protein